MSEAHENAHQAHGDAESEVELDSGTNSCSSYSSSCSSTWTGIGQTLSLNAIQEQECIEQQQQQPQRRNKRALECGNSSSGCSCSASAGAQSSVEMMSCSSLLFQECEEEEPDRKRPALSNPPDTIIYTQDEEEQQQQQQPEVVLPRHETANDPDDYLLQLVETMYPQVKLKVKLALELETYFPVITEEQMARYSMQIVNIARSNDVKGLKQFHLEHGRDILDCFNRFGEGLLNMACRRGFTEMVEFLLSPEVALDVRVRDDFGRTPLHDACWNPDPQLDICTWLMQKDPSLFLVADKRGFTPFQYARKNDWPIWRKFLFDNSHLLEGLSTTAIAENFRR